MTHKRNFRARVIEPATREGTGVAIELEFHEIIPGLSGDTIVVYLQDDVSVESAAVFVRELNRLGRKVKVF